MNYVGMSDYYVWDSYYQQYQFNGSIDLIDYMYEDGMTDTWFMLNSNEGMYQQTWRDAGMYLPGDPVNMDYPYYTNFYEMPNDVRVCGYEDYEARDAAMGYNNP